MGMGEPLGNLTEVLRALQSLNHDKGLNFSPRRITVSTCGLEKGLRQLGESGLAFLAVSLHAPNQELRARLMPKAARWPLPDLLAALKSYPLKTRERITFEYLLLGGVNDGWNTPASWRACWPILKPSSTSLFTTPPKDPPTWRPARNASWPLNAASGIATLPPLSAKVRGRTLRPPADS